MVKMARYRLAPGSPNQVPLFQIDWYEQWYKTPCGQWRQVYTRLAGKGVRCLLTQKFPLGTRSLQNGILKLRHPPQKAILVWLKGTITKSQVDIAKVVINGCATRTVVQLPGWLVGDKRPRPKSLLPKKLGHQRLAFWGQDHNGSSTPGPKLGGSLVLSSKMTLQTHFERAQIIDVKPTESNSYQGPLPPCNPSKRALTTGTYGHHVQSSKIPASSSSFRFHRSCEPGKVRVFITDWKHTSTATEAFP